MQNPDDACAWTFSFESVIGYGTVTELVAPEDKNHGLNQIMLHYSGREWDIPEHRTATTRVWRIDIESDHRQEVGGEGRRGRRRMPRFA